MIQPVLGNKRMLYVLLCAAVFAVCSILALDGVYGLEVAILRFFNSWPEFINPLFWTVSLMGTLAAVGVSALVASWRGHSRLAFQLLLAGAGAYLVSSLLKLLAVRVRPDELITGVIVREDTLGTYGFPSGHAAVATALATVLFMYTPKSWRLPIVVLGILVLMSRMYLGVHLPLDLIGGAAMGVFIALIVQAFVRSKK